MVTVCTKCSILMDIATVLEYFLNKMYTFRLKLMASCALSIWFSQSADKTLLPLKEIGRFLQTSAEAHQDKEDYSSN